MIIEYSGLSQITGPLVMLEGVPEASYDEMVELRLSDGSTRAGRVVRVEGGRSIIQVFEGTRGLSLENTRTRFSGRPIELPLSKEILGRRFDGLGRPADGLGGVYAECRRDINGAPMNPVSRVYPRDCIHTGISSIDGLATLIRGQKLPIFSGSGMKHNELAVQIVRQASLANSAAAPGRGTEASEAINISARPSTGDAGFAIVFAAMGVKNDVAQYFINSFEEAGAMGRVVMFLNLASDPIIERIVTPRCALTAAEYLAFEKGMHILVIMTDISSYAEALREFSSSKGEIPGRKGFPGYLYSDLASLYERAGILKGKGGSVTQLPILTMPNDDITHPIPDLTGYITEGQIVLGRELDSVGVYPPVSVLPSLSRLMKDGIGQGFTRADHSAVANQLFASYARVQDAKALASVIGEDELSSADRKLMEFGREFEKRFLNQGFSESRSIGETLDLGWALLSMLPRGELDRIDDETLEAHYRPATTNA